MLVCFGPLLTAGREAGAGVGLFRVANNQHDSVFRPVLGIRCECQRGSKKERGEKVSVHKRDGHVRGRNVNVRRVGSVQADRASAVRSATRTYWTKVP